MIPWHNIPLARILIPFLLGLSLAIKLEASACIWPWLPWLIIGLILIFQLLPARIIPFRRRWIHGILIGILYILCGYQLILLKPTFQYPDHFSWQIKDYQTADIIVCIDNEPLIRNGNIRAEARVLSIDGKSCSGKISLTLVPGKSIPDYGELLRIRCNIRKPDKIRNPYDFDYGKLLYNKGIYHLAYAKSGDWENLGAFRGNVILWAANVSRNYLVKILKDNGLKDDELDISAALLLGANANFDPELRQIYGKAGVTHILSVSGLHVGLVFLVFSYLLAFIRGSRFKNLLRAVILVLLIWGYAFLTGLSPAVQRSALMLSLVILAREMQRKPHLLNVLSASALLLLLIDPFLITNLGFQLSYLAVAGIVILERPIYELVEIENNTLDKAWKLCSVSFAAQGSTSPLSILYFHHFPLYFLPANLIIIPLSSLIMYWGLGSLALSWIPVIKTGLFFMLGFLVKSMTALTAFIASLPYADSGTLLPDTFQSLLLYVVLVSVIVFLKYKNFMSLWICMLSICSLCISGFIKQYNRPTKSYLVVFSTPKQGMISLVNKNSMQSVFLNDSSLHAAMPKELENIQLARNIETHTRTVANNQEGSAYMSTDSLITNVIHFDGKAYLLFNNSKTDLSSIENINGIFAFCDPGSNTKANGFPPELSCVVAGPGISKAGLRKWQTICNQLQIKFFDLKKRGAFVLCSG